MGRRLNLGAGDTVIPGFEPVDRKIGTEVYPLAEKDCSIEELRASHVLEHFTYKEATLVLRDWLRVLTPGSRIRIAVPDFPKVAKAYTDGDSKALFYSAGGQINENDIHKSQWDEKKLTDFLADAGFINVMRWESDGLDTSNHKVSLNLEAYKPEINTDGLKEIKIAAVLSMPRLVWTDHWSCCEKAFKKFGIPIHKVTGAFWGQCMQRGIEKCIDRGLDWIITLDYDTMFTEWDVDNLIGALSNNADIDAVAGLQVGRTRDTPLLTIKGETEVKTNGLPFQVATAHFGLTIIRLEALKDIPKPWFVSKPDPETGMWEGPNKLDADIWFWHQWREHGKTIYVHPGVKIGHLEVVVSQFDKDMNFEQISVNEWFKRKEEAC